MVRLRLGHLLAVALPFALAALGPLSRPACAQRAPTTAQASAPAPADDVVLIANPDVPVSSIDVQQARRIFMLRQRFWPHGRRVAPVNLPATSPLRRDFSDRVLGRSPQEMGDYWNDMYFHGTQPPPVLESERAVLLYVARTPGAIGYVRAGTLQAAPERDQVRTLLTTAP